MYRPKSAQMHLYDDTLRDVFELDPENRWVIRARLVPWEMAESKYAHMFRKNGRPAKDIRMALGALLVKEYLQCSDEEVVEQITENPYLQHFIGLQGFTNQAPFHPSLMVWFRKRLSAKFMNELNEAMCKAEATPQEEIPAKDDGDVPHGGTLVIDATCAPADIAYPTDTGLLADAIEKTDGMIDSLQLPLKGRQPRPRTYRIKSRKLYSSFTKNRKPNTKTIRRVKGKQLNYLRRNLKIVQVMLASGGKLTDRQKRILKTIETLYEQQREMYQSRRNRISNRIVSISQPHIRPIVRGKAGKPVEFGAKVHMSMVNGYAFINEVSYEAYHEGEKLKDAILDYYQRFGMLPARIMADRIYTNRANRKLCRDWGIKLMGKPLGRPRKEPVEEETGKYGSRNEIEGSFGTLKTRYGWDRVMARLPETGMAVISASLCARNLAKLAKVFWHDFIQWVFGSAFCPLTAVSF